MDGELTIQQVALTQLSGYALRYCERIGLLALIDRASSGQRRCSRQDVAWIEFINRFRATGMPIRRCSNLLGCGGKGTKQSPNDECS